MDVDIVSSLCIKARMIGYTAQWRLPFVFVWTVQAQLWQLIGRVILTNRIDRIKGNQIKCDFTDEKHFLLCCLGHILNIVNNQQWLKWLCGLFVLTRKCWIYCWPGQKERGAAHAHTHKCTPFTRNAAFWFCPLGGAKVATSLCSAWHCLLTLSRFISHFYDQWRTIKICVGVLTGFKWGKCCSHFFSLLRSGFSWIVLVHSCCNSKTIKHLHTCIQEQGKKKVGSLILPWRKNFAMFKTHSGCWLLRS